MKTSSILSSIGWFLLKRGISLLLNSGVLDTIKKAVVEMFSADFPGEVKHKLVVAKAAKTAQEQMSNAVKDIPVTVLDIATKIVYTELTNEEPTSIKGLLSSLASELGNDG